IPFADHHDIVETFPSNRPNYPLGIRVLPRGARRNHDFPDAQRLGLTPKSFAIDLVSVSEQILRSLLQAARLEQLPRRPFRGRVLGDTSRRRAWLSTTSTKSTRKVAVGTVKKSKAIRSLAWFLRNARHACDGGRRGRSMYFAPSPAIPLRPASAARRGSSARPRADWRGSPAKSALAVPP